MRKVKVDLDELVSAFDDGSPELTFYLDTDTREVVLVTDETRRELENIYEEIYGEGDEPVVALEEVLRQLNLPDWQQEELRTADLVEEGFGTRFVEVPKAESRDGYSDMEAFIDTVQDRRFQNRLWRAIQGKGAFRRFKDTLFDDPRERERWFAFQNERVQQRVLEWLEDEEIEPAEE
ncbi:MAG TPA: UPF0158 family protein [Herpetosiphonaceae bacterium]|nr:UPF0158 family protein [Herpetosiphonaceae bacterium]